MLKITSFAKKQRMLSIACLSAALTVGCASAQSQQNTEPERPAVEQSERALVVADDEPSTKTAERKRLEGQVSSLESDVAKLQLRLLESEARAAALQGAVDAAIMEAVRSKAKLQSVESRAEAASTMAEAEIALRTRRRTESNNPRVTQAAQFLEMSASEFNNENYGGALYLAVQSKDLVGDSPGRLSGFDTAQRPAEVPFYFSLSLRVTRSSNVREGPGTAFGVAFILEAGAHVTGHAYERQWVRISSEDGRSGWIYSTLVASR